MSRGDLDRSTDPLYRAALVALPIGPILVLAIVIISGEFDWKWLLATVTACAVLAAFVFAMYRWARPLARRLRNNLEGVESRSSMRRMEDTQRPPGGGGGLGLQDHAAAVDRIRWYKRVRFHIVWGLTQPVVVCAAAGALLGNLVELIALGIILGVAVALVWSFVWTVQHEELEKRGLRW
jgi:hypothetical protein